MARERRDAAFAAVEREQREALLTLTPVQRLEWLAEALEFALAAGVLRPPQAPPGWLSARR